MNRIEGEKALKRYLKRSIGYSLTILVGFLINGQISLGADINKELQIQELLKSIKAEKEELNEKLLELDKELAIVKNSKDNSIHILFSPTVEHRHAKKSDDNGFSDVIDDWEESIKDEPNIEIPDIRDDVKPNVPDIENPLPNEDSIVKEPEFEFGGIGSIAINDQLPDIDLSLDNLEIPVKEITDDEFNILTDDNISKPDVNLVEVDNTNLGNITQNIKTEITTPTLNNIVDLSNFFVGEITVNTPNVITPESFSLDTVKIKSGSLEQTSTEKHYITGNESDLYAVRNYTNYKADDRGFNIWVSGGGLFYDTEKTRGDKSLFIDGTELKYGEYAGGYQLNNGKAPTTTTYISDVIGKDVSVEGPFTLTYEGNRNGTDTTDLYVRIFLSSVTNGLSQPNSENTKITEFSGELNLATTNSNAHTGSPLYGNLIGLEHQLGDINSSDKTAILLNSGTINIGNRLDSSKGSTEEKNQEVVDKNMIGIMIDSVQTSENKGNGKTINAGEINIIKPELLPNEKDFTPSNNIGISFEENEAGNKSGATLKDDVYIGKINIGSGTQQNYGFRMGNIYAASSTYFDETKIIGNLDNNKTTIEIGNDGNTKVIKDYTSDIVVEGSQNVGMVVGKSLSSSADLNPIANFENISIKVNGDQTIGFVRDKNYSDNNTNDMVITDSNLNNVRFGENATNSVLFRSEMYGITNESEIDVTIANENTKATSDGYNVAMQALRQSWDEDGDGQKDINSSGSVTNGENGTISGTVNNMIGMMASGNIEDKVIEWQNGEQASEALATNKGTISLEGDNNIGMAIMDSNKGNNSGTITITGASGVGIYNTGTFENTGTADKKATVNVNGANGIGIYNNNNLTLENSTINIGGENSVGIYSEGGTIKFDSTTIIGTDNAIAGIYTKVDGINTTATIEGNVSITGTKVGLVSNDITTNVNGNLEYSGDGFALYTKGANGKIVFDSNSTLTLGGSAYGFDIVDTTKQEETPNQYINFNGATIEIKSNDVTLFNINGNGTEYASSSIGAGNSNLPGKEYLEQFVGEIGKIINSYEINGEKVEYEGYKIASIENGNILLNSTTVNNEEFLKKYKFQKSKISMSTDTNLTLSNTEADTYFSGEVIGIGISSNTSKDGEKATELDDTKINITGSTLTANRTETAPQVSEDENSSTKSTIGAYIDYGVINIGDVQEKDKTGHIVVEKEDNTTGSDIVNDNGIGIFSKNGSKVTVNEGSSITVYGNNGIGIYGEATKDGQNNQNKFGGTITKLDINNAGDIAVSSGASGIGIFADGGEGEENRGKVTNSGTITVGGGTTENSSIGIYGINTDITNTGSITVGSNINNKDSTGIGIYAQNSSVTLGEINKNVEFTLGDGATGVYLDGGSTLALNSDLVFKSLNSDNTTDRIGIYAKGEEEKTNSEITINQNIDMSDVVGGKAVVVDGRDVTVDKNTTITISGNNGRGIRVLDNGTITNKGTITINKESPENEDNPSSIGMVAANINGKIENTGTININSTNGIGIYVDNSDEYNENNELVRKRDGNKITSIGNINLNGDKNIGVVAKEFDLVLEEDGLTTNEITFGNSNGVGIYAENSNVTINEEISKTFNKDQTNNILIAGINGATIVNNNKITLSGGGSNNIGVYLGKNGEYQGTETGSITIENGDIGIYADKGASTLENINITSDSKGNQTIGVVLQGENKEEKIISGKITLTNTNSDVVQGKNIGVYANNSNVVVNEKEVLTLQNDGSNGTGLYLNDSTLSGSGTVKITGEGKVNSEGKISNSVGIYYTSTNKNNPITSNNQIKVEIDKSNTIGVYVSEGNTLTKGSEGIITLGKDEAVTDVTGLVASTESTITNEGKVILDQVTKGIGIASLGGTSSGKETIINNKGTIEITKNSISGTGIFLTGNSKLENTGTIIINEDTTTTDKHLGIGIYAKGEDVTIGATGTFDMAKGNVAIYSDGTSISSDIKLADSNDLEKNSGTTALVIKSDKGSTDTNITKGTLVGGTSKDKMEITLAKGSTGIYALDSGVEISNVSIDAKAHNQTNDELSYGIYLKAEKDGDYKVSNTDISLIKGVGIIVDGVDNLQGTEKDTKLTLSGSTINIDSYSEGNESNTKADTKETGIGIYTDSGEIALTGGNTINTSYGVGIFGGNNSKITTSDGDTLNLQGYSVGVYSKGGDVTLGAGTEISFNNSLEDPVVSGNYQGTGVYVVDGKVESAASITNENSKEGEISEGVIGLLGKQASDKEVTVTNSGNINLAGNSVVGIAGIGNGGTENIIVTNSGDITISGTYSVEEGKTYLSTGIYGKDTIIDNAGKITVGNYATGIYYTGTKANDITSNGITLTGSDSIGAILNGNTKDVNIGDIEGDILKNRNLGVYLNNYSSDSTKIGKITLGNESLGLYINNSSTTINSLGDVTVGTEGIGIASVGDSKDGTDTTTISNNGSISVGELGTAVYVKDSTLNMNSLANVAVGKGGTYIHVNGGTLNLNSVTNDTLTFNGNIGMIIENGGNVTSNDKSTIKNINVINGGTGILVRGTTTDTPSILDENATITLGSGSKESYSVGMYYQNVGDINSSKVDIEYAPETKYAIGTIFDRTYGTLENFNLIMDNTTSNSIGTIIRRDNYDEAIDKGNISSVTLNAEQGKDLINVNGQQNIGLIGKNSVILANGDIKVGLDETSSGSVGVYLTGTDSNWQHSYNGNGTIEAGSDSIGIYAKNYDVTHTGNITVNGKDGVGIASVILDDEVHGHSHTITVNDSTLTVENGAIGVFGRDTNIEVKNGNLVVSGENSTGIASLQDGNINFNGNASISGKGTSGIYKNTVLDNTNSNTKDGDKNIITVGKGDWTIDNTASGIVAISRNKENGIITDVGSSITVNNSSNMTLGNGAIGIYSAGANTVHNEGNIVVGGVVNDGIETLASIGIYMANGVGGTTAEGTNKGNITVENNGGVGIQVAGYVDFTNSGNIEVSNGAEGLHSSYGATITNEGDITIAGKGTGMIASGKNSKGESSTAINKGTITLEKDNTVVMDSEQDTQYNTSLIGMAAIDGGHIINSEEGTINVNDGIGMYVDKDSKFTNDGTINVNNGVGIMGVGKLENTGKIVVDSENSNAVGTVELDENLSNEGSLVVDRENGILEVNDNFSNIGGILETDYNIKLNNPTIDITQGGAGFIAPEMSGDIKLDSNFALEGDGISFSVEDFIDPSADININTSPLFDTELVEGDLTVNKVDYKDITTGNQYDNRDDSLDDILANGGTDAEILKNLNYYLDSLGNTTVFNSEADKMLGAIGGNIYSNIQSRMQDISRTFDNSFEEMLLSKNPTFENDKFHIIYTDGDYKNTNKNVVDYDYSIKGLNYMKEYDLTSQGKKYGYTFGFTGARFEFDNSFDSKEDIYSLRGGAHRISYLDNGVSWLTRGEIGYNHHRVERKVIIPGATESIDNRDWYGSYQVSLDNKLRKELFSNENSNFGAYTALNLEYGLFDDIKEKGNLELEVKSNDYFSSKAIVGVDGKVSKPLNNDWSIRLNGDINYSYDLGNNYDENEVRFRSNDDYYSLASEVESRDVLSGRVGVSLDKSDYMSIALHGQVSRDFRRDEDYWNVGLTFTYRFNNHAVPEKFLDMHNYFEFDKSELNSKEKENIKEMAEYINKNNMQGTLLIEGHTDDTGKATYNDKLSLKRANSVEEEFKKNLTNKENIQIKVVGYGENKPEYKNINESTRSKNRRAQVNILNK